MVDVMNALMKLPQQAKRAGIVNNRHLNSDGKDVASPVGRVRSLRVCAMRDNSWGYGFIANTKARFAGSGPWRGSFD